MSNVLASRQETNYMHMVADAANTNDLTASCINKLANITVHTLQMLVGYLWTRSLRVEDNVQIYFAKRL